MPRATCSKSNPPRCPNEIEYDKAGCRIQANPIAGRARRLRRPGEDLRPWRQGTACAQGRLPQSWIRRRPDALAAALAQSRFSIRDEGVARRIDLERPDA